MHFEPKTLKRMISCLEKGEVIAAPAEGVYGFCADPFNPIGLEGLLEIKKRSPGKGFVVIVSSVGYLNLLTQTLNQQHWDLIDEYWPGPTTLLLPARDDLHKLLTGGSGKVAVRLPASPHMKEYLDAWGGPLVSTSANLSGQPPAQTAEEIKDKVFILPSQNPLNGSVSTIIDAETGQRVR